MLKQASNVWLKTTQNAIHGHTQAVGGKSSFRWKAESRVYSKACVPSGCFLDSAFQRNDDMTLTAWIQAVYLDSCHIGIQRAWLMAFQRAIYGLSMCNSCPFGVQFMLFRCTIHALSVRDSCPFGVQFILFQRAIYGFSMCDSQPYASGLTMPKNTLHQKSLLTGKLYI